jgi:hypothetical protein
MSEPGQHRSARRQSWKKFMIRVGVRCGRAFIEWLAHSILLFGIFACVQGLRCALQWIGVPASKKFFGCIPLEWLFDGADLALLIGIGIVGVTAVVRSYRDEWK